MVKVSCNETFTIPQPPGNPYCWFTALLAVLFYSDETSAFFKRIIPGLRKKTTSKKKLEIYDLIDELLSAKYIKNLQDFKKFYTTLNPKNLLKQLHARDKKHFYFDPNRKGAKGYRSEEYLLMFFQFLGVHDKVLFLNKGEDKEGKIKYFFGVPNAYDFKSKIIRGENVPYALERDKLKHPERFTMTLFRNLDFNKFEVILVTTGLPFHPSLEVPCVVEKDKLKFDSEQVVFKADAVLLSNFNRDTCGKGHKIAGVTCNGKRYLYNGWTINDKVKLQVDQIYKDQFFHKLSTSCNLFEFDWIKQKLNFCFDMSKCLITQPDKTPQKEICYNIKKEKTTTVYVRVRQGKKVTKKGSPNVKLKDLLKKPDCPPGKTRNPKTGRCVKVQEKKVKVKGSPDIKLKDLLKKQKPEEKLSKQQLTFISAFNPDVHDEIKKCLTQKAGRKSEKCKRWKTIFEGFL